MQFHFEQHHPGSDYAELESHTLKTLPLDFYRDGANVVPSDDALWDAVRSFSVLQLGEPAKPDIYVRFWAVVEETGVEENPYEVFGIASVWHVVDVPLLHVYTPGKDKDDRHKARAVRDLLVGRLRSWCQDQGLSRKTVLVSVAADAQRKWMGFLKLIGAKSADRWTVEI